VDDAKFPQMSNNRVNVSISSIMSLKYGNEGFDMSQIGEILAELRKDRGLRQRDVSKLANISISTVSAYETGARYPGVDMLSTLSSVYDVTTDYLLGLSSSDISPEVLNEAFIDGETFGEILYTLRSFSQEDRKVVMTLILALRQKDAQNVKVKKIPKGRYP